MDRTLGYYKAFLHELIEDMEKLLVKVRQHPIPDIYGIHLNTVGIRKPEEGDGHLVAVIEVDLSFMFTETYHYEDYVFLYGIDVRGLRTTLKPIDSYERTSINYYHYLFGNPCQDWIFRIPYTIRYVAQKRVKQIKKDLIATAWRPDRIAKWVDAGVDLEDM